MSEHLPAEPGNRRQIETLWNRIVRSFPPVTPRAGILAGGDEPVQHPTRNGTAPASTPHNPRIPIPDTEDLLRNLKAQRWDHLPPEFIERHPGDFVLLTADAFAAFIPAWLLFALGHNLDGSEFIAYTFAPEDLEGSLRIRALSVEMFQALNPAQRRALRDFLIYIAEYHPSDYVSDHAAAAVDGLSDLIAVFEPEPAAPPPQT